MVAVPIRLAPAFAANDNATLPLPLPLLPAVIVIHESFAAADHAHPAVVVTVTVVDDAPAGTFADCGVIANAHAGGGGVAAACVIVETCPATVTVPVRLAPVLAAIESATLPLPVPLAPAVMTIQETLDVAVQAQPLPAVTPSGVAVPPAATIDCAPGAKANEHAGGAGGGAPAAACETATSASATRTTVVRAAPAFAATWSTTVAVPLPPVIDAVTQEAPAVVDHAQPAEVATTISNEPPPAAADTC